MRFGEEFLDELKSRLRPSEVIGRSVKLRRQGREFAGLSPFNKEKTPSFFVNDEKGFYHCFSSGKHGDIISFVQETEGLSFVEAVQRLAAEAGLAMPETDPEEAKRFQQRNTLRDWVAEAAKFYAAELTRVRGRHARQYLAGRELDEADWAAFGLGYAPSQRTGLKDHLVQLGAKKEQLIEAGLLVQPEKGGEPFDRFRDRIMFPIADIRGRITAFGARALSPDAKAKYLNSPETPLFHKGKTLYRFAEARKAAAQQKRDGLLVAEGYMDVIALAKAGFGHAVAPLGTALTEDQMALLWRVGPEPVLCFDGDAAGKRAAYRALDRALPVLEPGHTLRFAWLPDGVDPDDLIRAKGAGAMQDVLAKSQSMVDVLWEREWGLEPLDTPEQKAGLTARLRALCEQIGHKELAALYRRELFDRVAKKYANRRQSSNWRNRSRAGPSIELRKKVQKGSGSPAEQRFLVAWIIKNPSALETLDEVFAELILDDSGLNQLRNAVLDLWLNNPSIDRAAITSHLTRVKLTEQLNLLENSSGNIKLPQTDDPAKAWLQVAEELNARAGANEEHAALEARLLESLMDDDPDAYQQISASRRRQDEDQS
ncbi:DNA primase [hydrothermal vent metagenome]|uniref:DNA primase n=1 Tax=hydrothermal vent metagenome TaxID=652676 RepID=A0A3B0RRV4_9ZZZZ